MSKPARMLSLEYERLHIAKENAFWAAKMGLGNETGFDAAEKALATWLQDPARLEAARAAVSKATSAEERVALEGWVRTLEAHTMESPAARALAAEIIDMEGELERTRGAMDLGYIDPDSGERVRCSSVKLSTLLLSGETPALRRAAWEGLREIEPFVLASGYIALVKARNRLGRMLGGEDYYDWKVRRVEGMTKAEVFALLDVLLARTEQRHRDTLASLEPHERTPWNFRHAIAGDVTRELDPYFPFAAAVERWGRTFVGLGIGYAGATLVLDLVDRDGKYSNGFCHMPEPSWRDEGRFKPGRIQFTANAIPGMVGSGRRASQTLFHEGGHAAHFANVDMPAPCFSQEFAPTSAAFAEVQSMFLDSLLSDADWQARYARTRDGEAMPFALIEKALRVHQRGEASSLRAMCSTCYAERTIYEIPDDELSPERVLAEVRAVENRLLGMDATRPALSVPHLLSGEASAYYHSYVLAQMGVAQTREHFLSRDGHLVDNPAIGPDLRRCYWQPGNSKRFSELIAELTGKPASAEALARAAAMTGDEVVAEALERIARLDTIPSVVGELELDGHITIVHGNETVATTASSSFAGLCDQFATWIDAQVESAR
ncbi:MAG TPA: M3 family metallopeptidase [Kofleriaceae bacterium]|nr:M3 family metallopeptidase [Kofleriaceae bacterium]